MSLENFIKEALHQPNDYVAYHIGRELAELHPAKAIIEGDTGSFELEAFARAEKCEIVYFFTRFLASKSSVRIIRTMSVIT